MPPSTPRPLIRNSLPPEGIVFVVILLFVAVCAVLRNVNMLVVVSGMMFAPLLLCWRLSRSIVRNVVVQRLLPNRVHVGQPANIQWRLSNRGRMAASNLSCRDTVRQLPLRHRRQSQPGVVHFGRIAAGETAYASYRVWFAQRGRCELGPAVVSCQFPLPLFQCWFRTRQIEEIYIAPKLGQMAVNWKQVLSRLASGREFQSRSRGPQEEDFFGIRKWRSGDNLRKIHWRSTAKYRQPMVKQFDGLADQDLTLVLDLFLDPDRPETTRTDCELILSFAATLVAHWAESRAGKLVVAIAGADSVICTSSDGAEFVKATMRRLALAQATAEPNTALLVNEANQVQSASRFAIVLSPRSAPGKSGVQWPDQTRVNWLCCRDQEFDRLFSLGDHDGSQHESAFSPAAGRS